MWICGGNCDLDDNSRVPEFVTGQNMTETETVDILQFLSQIQSELAASGRRTSVICFSHEQLNNHAKEKPEPSESEHDCSADQTEAALIVSVTSSVNLLTISAQDTAALRARIQEASLAREQFSPSTMLMAKIELAFLLSKSCTESLTSSKYEEQDLGSDQSR